MDLEAAAKYAEQEMWLQAARIVRDYEELIAAHKAAGTLTEEVIAEGWALSMAKVMAAMAEPVESRLWRALIMTSGG